MELQEKLLQERKDLKAEVLQKFKELNKDGKKRNWNRIAKSNLLNADAFYQCEKNLYSRSKLEKMLNVLNDIINQKKENG